MMVRRLGGRTAGMWDTAVRLFFFRRLGQMFFKRGGWIMGMAAGYGGMENRGGRPSEKTLLQTNLIFCALPACITTGFSAVPFCLE